MINRTPPQSPTTSVIAIHQREEYRPLMIADHRIEVLHDLQQLRVVEIRRNSQWSTGHDHSPQRTNWDHKFQRVVNLNQSSCHQRKVSYCFTAITTPKHQAATHHISASASCIIVLDFTRFMTVAGTYGRCNKETIIIRIYLISL